nr:hypothetical protein [Abalone asfa-like virus]
MLVVYQTTATVFWLVAHLKTDTQMEINQNFAININFTESFPVYYVTYQQKLYILLERPTFNQSVLLLTHDNLVDKVQLQDQSLVPALAHFPVPIYKIESYIFTQDPTTNITDVLEKNELPALVKRAFLIKYQSETLPSIEVLTNG